MAAAWLWLGGAVLLSMLALFSFQRQWLYPRPKKGLVLASAHHDIEAFALPTGAGVLQAWLARPRQAVGPFRGVVYFNGRRENPTSIFRALAHLPNSHVLCFFYRRLGPSLFKPDEAQLVRDGLAVFDWMARQHGVGPERLHVIGRSLGSGLAVQVAAARPVAGLVLISPFDRLLSAVRVLLPFWPAWALRDSFDSARYMHRLACPGLMVLGAVDKTVPPVLSRRLQAALAQPWPELLLADAGHRGLLKRPEVHEALGRFVEGGGVSALEGGGEVLDRHRASEQKALAEAAAVGDQEVSLGLGLDTLGQHFQAQVVAHADDGLDNHRVVGLQPDVADERPVDLELIERQPGEVGQR